MVQLGNAHLNIENHIWQRNILAYKSKRKFRTIKLSSPMYSKEKLSNYTTPS